jgi:hypothetical protein
MEFMVNAMELSTDRAWTEVEIKTCVLKQNGSVESVIGI